MGSIAYFAGDERPAWQPTVTVNGTADDLSTGYSFTVTLTKGGTVALTKTTGITGAAAGVVTVAWSPNELDLTPGTYEAQLVAKRTSDNHEWTIVESLHIRNRN